MSLMQGYRCDSSSCASQVAGTPDDGPPEGWYQMMRLGTQGSWQSEDERHYCCVECLKVGVEEVEL